MTDVTVTGVGTAAESPAGNVSLDRLRTIVQDSHLNFLIGAGTSSGHFGLLGDVENALTAVSALDVDDTAKRLIRASIQAYFFDRVIQPNVGLLHPDAANEKTLQSYAAFGRTLNRLLLGRRSSLLSKKASIFTTNVDLAFEVAFERLGVHMNDGFAGKISPSLDLGSYGSLRFRSGIHYEHRSEVPTFDLYKLHGSVGWRWTTEPSLSTDITFDRELEDVAAASAALAEIRDELLPIDTPEAVNAQALAALAEGMPLPAGYEDFERAYARLIIVNPEKEKFATTVLVETYYELIRRFANELERENSVLFVHGFSFRDEHLRTLVVRAARTNPTLQVIVFCHRADDRDQYRALLPKLDIPNGNVAYIMPLEAEETVLLNLETVVDRYLAPLVRTAPQRSDVRIELNVKTDGDEPS